MSPSSLRFFKLIFCSSLLLSSCYYGRASEDDLYSILGVARDASTPEIKRAYRRKARDTHPDKQNKNNADSSTEEFRKVVDAFEVLSDPQSRQYYDRTGRTKSSNSGGRSSGQQRHQHHWSWHFSSSSRRRPLLKDTLKVKEAQMRVMHVVSMAQLQTVMLDVDKDDVLERSLLMCFVTPPVESIATDELLFPYPFAGMSSQSIWWEDILQSVMVRYHRSNELTDFFEIPHGDELRHPVVVYVRKGDPLSKFTKLTGNANRQFLETWVWKQLEVEVAFNNRHNHPIELYWASGTSAQLKATIQPNESHFETTMLSHEYLARDARVDRFPDSPGRYKLLPNSTLGSWKILSTEPQSIDIVTRSCVDMSGHCYFWSVNPKGECERNTHFMHDKCPRTCNVCNDDTDGNHNSTSSQQQRGNKDEL